MKALPAEMLAPFEVAIKPIHVELQIVDALVGFHLDERFQAGIEFVADAPNTGILVEVAVVVARRGAVGELRGIIRGAIEGALERHRHAAELLRHADRIADVEVERQLGELGLQVRAAGIVGVDEIAHLEIELGVARDVDAAVNLGVEKGHIERRQQVAVGVLGPGADDIGGERMIGPQRRNPKLRCDNTIRRGRTARGTFRIGAVAGRHIDRRQQQERSRANA